MPSASEEIAQRLASGGGPFRIAGAGTKQAWGRPLEGLTMLDTERLDRVVAHEAGDFTAVLQAGVPLAHAQHQFAAAGQMLALDPPDMDGTATIGGVIATADSGPLRHRYGAPRDLVIGATMALADGSVARAGGRVIKNVAGYDLAKLAAGSYGTLGVVTEVCVRLHPRPASTATAVVRHDDPEAVQASALALIRRPLEADAIDVRWADGEGALLVRFGGPVAAERARAVAPEVTEDDDALWNAQRAGQRGAVVVRVAAMPTDLAAVLRAARDTGASVVGRAGVGTSWLKLPATITAETIEALRTRLRPRRCVVTDAPAALRAAIDPWDIPDGPELALMRRLRERFDPNGVCNPGLHV